MNFDGYYEMVLEGLKLFEAPFGIKRSFDHWVSSVSEWLNKNNEEQDLIFEWFSLNLVEDQDPLRFLEGEEKLHEYLTNISERFSWLAKLPHEGKLPSTSVNFIKDLNGKVKLCGPGLDKVMMMGINGLRFKEYHQGHQNFQLWLRSIADKCEALSPDSGLAAEWLSLPVVTFYLDGALMGGSESYFSLVDAVKERLNWLDKVLDVKTEGFIEKIESIEKTKAGIEISLDPILNKIKPFKINQFKVEKTLTDYQSLLKSKEWLTLNELESYTGYKKKTLYNWTSSGSLPHSKPRGKLMFKRSEIDKWLMENSGYLKGPRSRQKQSFS